MANLPSEDRAMFAKHPLDTSLDHLLESLQKAEQNYKPGPPLSDGTADSYTTFAQR